MILGMLGQKRVGKDTAADYIIRNIDPSYEKRSLATPMKEAVKIIFGWTEEHVNGDLKEVVDPFWGISPRQALTTIGTEWGQLMLCKMFPQFETTTGRKLWVKSLLRNVNKDSNIIIADVRFQHEVDAIHELDGKVIKIVRPSLVNTDTHESEKGWMIDNFDYLITNDATLIDFYKKIEVGFKFFNPTLCNDLH